jgi:hypothetical protein
MYIAVIRGFGFDKIYDKAFDDLAGMRVPDLTAFDGYDVYRAFCFLGSGQIDRMEMDNDAGLERMCREVHRRSEGHVTMEQSDFRTGIKGPHRTYILRDSNKEMRISLGPFGTPFRRHG